jgi:dihydrodipicolinate synthase/N-acetylneuraminate lyase
MKKLFGVTVAMITPLDEDGQIIEFALRKHVDFPIDKGGNCLYPGGTTGEMYLLSVTERKRLAETVVQQADCSSGSSLMN